MKNYLLLVFSIIFLVISCSQPCDDVNCLNGGVCNDGSCYCPQGFIGDYCEIAITGPCDTLVCQNGGYCEDGWCYGCESCFEGQYCQIEARQKFVGTFNGFLNDNAGGLVDFVYSVTFDLVEGNPCRLTVTDNIGNSYYVLAQSNSNNVDIPLQALNFDGTNSTVSGYYSINTDNLQTLYGTLYFQQGYAVYFQGLIE